MVTRSRPPPVSLPSMFVPEVHSCLPQTVTLTWGFKQCWRQHTQLLLSNTSIKYNTPDGQMVHIFSKTASTYMPYRTALSTAQSLAGSFLRYILYVSCVDVYKEIRQSHGDLLTGLTSVCEAKSLKGGKW